MVGRSVVTAKVMHQLKRCRLFVMLVLSVGLVFSGLAQAESSAQASKREVALPTVKVSPQKVMLGEAVNLVIKGEGVAKSLTQFDWQGIKQHFVLQDWRQDDDYLRLKLYPIRTGLFELPRQKAGRIAFPLTQIQVVENPEVSIQWQRPLPSVYSQQNVVWSAQVEVKDTSFKVSIEASENENSDAVSEKFATRVDDSNRYHQVWGHYEMPSVLSVKSSTWHSPVVWVKNRTQRRWKFFDDPQAMTIQPLPLFIPLSAVVAKVEWQHSDWPWWHEVDRLYTREWQLTAYDVTPSQLKRLVYDLVSPLREMTSVNWLAESVEVSQSYEKSGLLTTLKVTLPYRVKTSGWQAFPEVFLRSFDPNSGRVLQMQELSQSTLALPTWVLWGLILGLSLTLLWLAVWVYSVSRQAWLNVQFKRHLQACQSVEALWPILTAWRHQQLSHQWFADNWIRKAPSEAGDKALSLQEWLVWYETHYPENESLRALIEGLQQYHYAISTNSNSMSELQPLIQSWLEHLPVWRFKLDLRSNKPS